MVAQILFANNYPHFDVINWPVGTSCGCGLNHFNHIKTFLHLAKHGVLAIKMGSTTNSRVNLHLFISQTRLPYPVFCLYSQFVLKFLKSFTISVTTHLHNLCTMF